tara:strand:- start:133 stop:546 length:414 start_codon:yes stop_codon:yes gene_type:complete
MTMDGVILTPLKVIDNPKGDILHGIKKTDQGYSDFGEAYFSKLNFGEIKGWTKHKRMTLNLIVPVGKVFFVVYNKISFFEVTLSIDNYQRLTLPPGLWLAFKGLANESSLILNVANIVHEQNEMKKIDLDKISYKWD